MKKILLSLGIATVTLFAQAQNTQEAAAAAAAALSAAEEKPEVVEKPKYWTNTIVSQRADLLFSPRPS